MAVKHKVERDALAADAARYRWLTRHIVDGGDMNALEAAFSVLGDADSCTQHEFNAAIDNAMKEAK
jgi:hypothetical protein